MEKKCLLCGKEHSRRSPYCSVECKNKHYYMLNKDRLHIVRQEYYQDNKEKCDKRHYIWVENNKEKFNNYQKEWGKAKRKRIKEAKQNDKEM